MRSVRLTEPRQVRVRVITLHHAGSVKFHRKYALLWINQKIPRLKSRGLLRIAKKAAHPATPATAQGGTHTGHRKAGS